MHEGLLVPARRKEKRNPTPRQTLCAFCLFVLRFCHYIFIMRSPFVVKRWVLACIRNGKYSSRNDQAAHTVII